MAKGFDLGQADNIPAPPPDREIPALLVDVSDKLDHLEHAIHVLKGKVSPVTREVNEAQASNPQKCSAATTEVGRALDVIATRTLLLTTAITDITDKIEL